MSELRAAQEAMRAALHDEDPSRLRARLPPGMDRRIEVYRGMYWSRLVESLEDDFPRVRALLGEEAFERAARTHLREHPSQHPSLAWVGQALPETLMSLGYDLEGEIASLEWARVAAFWSPDVPVATAAELGAHAERLAEARLALHPSLQVVSLSGKAFRLATSRENEVILGPAREERVTIVVWRHRTRVEERMVPPLEADALERARRGDNFATICEVFLEADLPEDTAIRAVVRWVSAGWVSGPRFLSSPTQAQGAF